MSMAIANTNGAGPRPLTLDQIRRYQRQIIMPEVGSIGQRKLLDSSVVLIGAGGLGSPAALYLAAGRGGAPRLVGFDVVGILEPDPPGLPRHQGGGSAQVGAAGGNARRHHTH